MSVTEVNASEKSFMFRKKRSITILLQTWQLAWGTCRRKICKKSHFNSVLLKNNIQNCGKISYHGFSPGQREGKKTDETISTLSRNVNSQNSTLALRKSPYSAQDVSFTLPESIENVRKITRFHVFRIYEFNVIKSILTPLFKEQTEERKVVQSIRITSNERHYP